MEDLEGGHSAVDRDHGATMLHPERLREGEDL